MGSGLTSESRDGRFKVKTQLEKNTHGFWWPEINHVAEVAADRYHGIHMLYWLDTRPRAASHKLSEIDTLTFFARGYPVHCNMFSRIPDLYSLDAKSTPNPGDNQT